MSAMISMAEAVEIIRAHMPEPEVVEEALEDALGRPLAEDILAPEPSPRYTNSAMDGYAVRWQDVRSCDDERPAALEIVGESRAGVPHAGPVAAGEAVRISTGAMVPPDCDTVIRVENTSEEDGRVLVRAARRQGQDIRRAGEEFGAGDLILCRGERISAPVAGLLAAVGCERVRVYRPCRVAVLVTGSELVAAGAEIAAHQIRDSNMIMLAAAIRESGGEVAACRWVEDDLEATVAAVAAAKADLVICSGGVSVGRHDHVKAAAAENGFEELFWRIRQKPGKPLFLARKGKTLLFGLPGNPVSAFMCFTHYVRPVIAAMGGQGFGWPVVSGTAGRAIVNNGKRTNMIRVRLVWEANGGYRITDAEKQGSHMLTSLSGADGYIVLPPGGQVEAGQSCDVYRYSFTREPRAVAPDVEGTR